MAKPGTAHKPPASHRPPAPPKRAPAPRIIPGGPMVPAGGGGSKPPQGHKPPAPPKVIPGGPMIPAPAAHKPPASHRPPPPPRVNPGGPMVPVPRGLAIAGLVAPVCTMAAIADSLQLATGVAVPAEEILAQGEWLTIEQGLERAASWGLEDAWPVSPDCLLPGLVAGLQMDEGAHTALLAGRDAMVTWGGVMPLRGAVEEAWALRWAEVPCVV